MSYNASGSETRGQVNLAMLVPAYNDAVRYWDSQFQGVIRDIMAVKNTPMNQLNFRWPVAVNTGLMAPIADETSPAVFMETATYMENFQLRMAQVGWKMEPTMWDTEIAHGKMGVSFEFKVKMASEAMERRLEFEGLKYLTGDSSTIARYSSQGTDRLKSWDVEDSTTGLYGNPWGTIVSTSNLPDILFDLDTVQYYAKHIGDRPMKKLIIGPATFYSMQRNIKLKEDLKYVHDTRQNIVGGELRGLNISEVVYARYKEVNSNWANMQGAPGLGSLAFDKWSDLKSQNMMRHAVDAKLYEFGLITADEVGNIWSGPVFTSPEYPTGSDVTHAYWNDDPLELRAWRKRRFGYSVDDFANVHLLTNLVEINATTGFKKV